MLAASSFKCGSTDSYSKDHETVRKAFPKNNDKNSKPLKKTTAPLLINPIKKLGKDYL